MKILITGTGTLLGKTIAKKLSTKYDILAAYNKSYPKYLSKNKNIKIIKIDLKNEIKLKEKFDVLVHCASLVPAHNPTKKMYEQVNYYGFKKLISLCNKKNCHNVILISTMSVYGKINSDTITEKTYFKNPDIYGNTKIKMEKILKRFCNDNDKKGIILRLPGIIGPKSKNNFLSFALDHIKKKKFITINNPNLKFNNIAHVESVSNVIYNYINCSSRNLKIFNMCTTRPILFKNIFKIIFKELNLKEKIYFSKTKNKGFNININKNLKKYKLFTTSEAIKKFVRENLN
jgi:nucleoside-diphosphate-sugar epimerase